MRSVLMHPLHVAEGIFLATKPYHESLLMFTLLADGSIGCAGKQQRAMT